MNILHVLSAFALNGSVYEYPAYVVCIFSVHLSVFVVQCMHWSREDARLASAWHMDRIVVVCGFVAFACIFSLILLPHCACTPRSPHL